MFKVSDEFFDIRRYDGRVVVTESKISVSGIEIAKKEHGLRSYWKRTTDGGIFYLDESTLREINADKLFQDPDLVKNKCSTVLSKRIFEKVESPFLAYISDEAKSIRNLPVTDKESLEKVNAVRIEILQFIENPAISSGTKDALSKVKKGFFDFVPTAIELKKRCSIDILKTVLEHLEQNQISLNSEQKTFMEIFMSQYKHNLKLGFFLDNLDKIKYPTSNKKRILEVVLGPTANGIEDDLLSIYS